MFGQDDSFSSGFEDEFLAAKKVESYDPLKGYNIQMTKFNDFVYMNMLGPIAKGYRYIVPTPVRTSVSNFATNLLFPIRFINNILQLKFYNAFEETNRFLINSTIGLAGLFDPATSQAHIKPHVEDFGQTLGFYGIGNDIHIVLPLLGPSNLRDTIGLVADSFLSPVNYAYQKNHVFDNSSEFLLYNSYIILNEYSFHQKEYESIRKDALNPYILLKNIYEQRRKKLIKE